MNAFELMKIIGFGNYTQVVSSSVGFVALGYAGAGNQNTILYSSDGINWTGLGRAIFQYGGTDVCWNGEKFVAVGLAQYGGTNSIAYSYDGVNWTGLGSSVFSEAGYGVCWNGSIFVACGRGTHNIAYSSDGINWTGIQNQYLNFGFDVIYDGEKFWIAGANVILYSSDGINWTKVNGFSHDFRSICYNGSIYVVGGATSNDGLYYSVDGLSWTPIPNIFGYCQDICWGGDKFVGVGYGQLNTIAYSYDGINWVGLGMDIIGKYGGDCAVCWNGEKFTAVSYGSGTSNSIAYSSDGINWTGLGILPFNFGSGICSTNAPNLYPPVYPAGVVDEFGYIPGVEPDSWKLRIETTGASQAFIVTLELPDSINIDWGDNSDNTYTTGGDKSHTYTNAGTYILSISGSLQTTGNIRFDNENTRARLKATGVPPNLGGMTTNAYYCTFFGCIRLTSIPTDFGRYNTGMTTGAYDWTFANCTGLTSIPADFGRYNTGMTYYAYYGTFYGCTGLTSIPTDFGRYNTAMTSDAYNSAFSNCTGLTSIPTDFGRYNTAMTSSVYNSTFLGCTGLTSIPTTFGSYNTGSITTYGFIYTFRNCANLDGNAPALWTSYTDATHGADCFNGCTGLDNYASIPTVWK